MKLFRPLRSTTTRRILGLRARDFFVDVFDVVLAVDLLVLFLAVDPEVRDLVVAERCGTLLDRFLGAANAAKLVMKDNSTSRTMGSRGRFKIFISFRFSRYIRSLTLSGTAKFTGPFPRRTFPTRNVVVYSL
jgi:hypothetical protein